jgi:hypothetical protein
MILIRITSSLLVQSIWKVAATKPFALALFLVIGIVINGSQLIKKKEALGSIQIVKEKVK